jgi:hypothetical protein
VKWSKCYKLFFTLRYNFRSRLCPLGPTHQDDCTNPWHQAHPLGQDDQFVVPRHRGWSVWYKEARDTLVINGPYLVVFADLADQIGKSLIDINSLLSRCLNKATPEMLSEVTTLCVKEA